LLSKFIIKKHQSLEFIAKTLADELSEKENKMSDQLKAKPGSKFWWEPIREQKKRFEVVRRGEWNSSNSRGTYRINTELYQA
jgi:hypothetical protein